MNFLFFSILGSTVTLLTDFLNTFLIGSIEISENIIAKNSKEFPFPVNLTMNGTSKNPIIDAMTSPIPNNPINLLL